MNTRNFSCSFRVDGKQWSICIKRDFIDIRCDALSTVAQLDCETITYDDADGYTCGMDMTEHIFRGSNGITMTINHSVPREDHPDFHILEENASIEMSGNGHLSRNPIPVAVARAIPHIIMGEYDRVTDLGAYLCRF
jgi:hypothetical protein